MPSMYTSTPGHGPAPDGRNTNAGQAPSRVWIVTSSLGMSSSPGTGLSRGLDHHGRLARHDAPLTGGSSEMGGLRVRSDLEGGLPAYRDEVTISDNPLRRPQWPVPRRGGRLGRQAQERRGIISPAQAAVMADGDRGGDVDFRARCHHSNPRRRHRDQREPGAVVNLERLTCSSFERGRREVLPSYPRLPFPRLVALRRGPTDRDPHADHSWWRHTTDR